jgi:predicted porin
MNKKMIALAVAAATLAPAAMAQTANPVTLYGRAYVMFENVKADGGTAAPIGSRNRVSNTGPSFFGIRGTEDLGGGLKAFFQMETEFRLDQNDTTFAARNSAIGLQGDFGSVLLGRWDTPMKVASAKYDAFGDTTLSGFAGMMSDRGNFNRRDVNTVQYWSPNFDGVQFRVGYAANEGKTATVNPKGISANITYDKGPVSLAYSYEKHTDQIATYAVNNTATAVTGAEEVGHSLGGSVTLGGFRIAGLTQRFIKPNVAIAGVINTTPVQKSNMVNLMYTAGKHQFVFQHLRSKDGRTRAVTTTVAQPDNKTNSIGYFYNFSRRTAFISTLTQVKNNAGGLGNFGSFALNGTLGQPTLALDQDPRGIGFGIRHLF